jgi:hypothetical protein
MATTITDKLMRSTKTTHTARLTDAGWEVSWLPGRVLDRNQAVTAMQIAAHVGGGVGLHDDPIWPHIDGWARELGLTGPDAVVRASEPQPAEGETEAGQ